MRTIPLFLLVGCLGDPHVDCVTDVECRDAFGFGQQCGDIGYCEAAELPARCTTSYPTDLLSDPAAYSDAVIFGSLGDGLFDSAEMSSVRLAFIEAERAGGIDGTPVALVECTYEENPDIDDLPYPDSVALLGEALAGRFGIQGFIGPYTSGQTEALFNATQAERPFIISPSATSPALTFIDGVDKSDETPGTLWRTAPPDSLQGQVAAQDMIARGRTRVAVVYQSGAYGDGLAQIFTEQFTSSDRTTLGLPFGDTSELAAHVSTIEADPTIQEVFVISGEASDVAAFLNGAGSLLSFDDETGPGRGIFLADAAKDTDMLDALTEDGRTLLDQIRGTAPAAPNATDTTYNTFKQVYEQQFPGQDAEATIYMPYSYDAAWLALYAATWSRAQEGGLTGAGMGAGMRQVSSGDEIQLLSTDWNTGRALLDAGRSIDVKGSSGALDYDPATEETTAPMDVWVVNAAGDGFETTETVDP